MGDLIAAVAGVVLFVSLFFDWYSVESNGTSGFGVKSFNRTGWESLAKIDVLLCVFGLVAAAVAVARLLGTLDRLSPAVTPGFVVFALGALAFLLTLFRLLKVPGGGIAGSGKFPLTSLPGVDVHREAGVFIAFLAAIGVVAGGWIGWNAEGRPTPGDETRRRGSSREMPPATERAPD